MPANMKREICRHHIQMYYCEKSNRSNNDKYKNHDNNLAAQVSYSKYSAGQ